MADAGRRLVPEGHNRPEDVPRLEAYFQEVCEREPKFLLWRKQSYPGAFAFRKGRTWGGRKKGGSCRDRPAPGSADEADESGGGLLRVEHTAPGKFDLQKLRREFFTPPKEEAILLDALYSYLYRQHPVGNLDHEKLIDRLREHLAAEQERRRPAPVEYEGDMVQRNLLETLRRYFGKSPNRQKVISDLLTDRKKLERLYFDLRQRRGPPVRDVGPGTQRELRQHRKDLEASFEFSVPPASPPLILEETTGSRGTQTESIADHSWVAVTEEAKRLRAAQEAAEEEARSPPPGHGRRSSVDNDDVSPSVSDTIKRYLRMARKKSVDSDKADRFKRVNYDRNLRNIKAKGELSKISDDDGLDKGAQTDESWIEALRELKLDTLDQSAPASSRSSLTEDPVSPTSPKSLLSSGHSFLSNLLHGRHPDRSVSAGGMQKSKSSTSVVQQGSRLVAKKIWKTRSKSQSRATPSATSAWTPQVTTLSF
ncbi:hypothetical protein AAG570_005444 [Ranatra chinensis]|uniref:Uncharacterized protein n=1 Tax=Ranatra chinensis TaxID=642074 RepID=A0ABD0YJ68_9HEMI